MRRAPLDSARMCAPGELTSNPLIARILTLVVPSIDEHTNCIYN